MSINLMGERGYYRRRPEDGGMKIHECRRLQPAGRNEGTVSEGIFGDQPGANEASHESHWQIWGWGGLRADECWQLLDLGGRVIGLGSSTERLIRSGDKI